MGDETQVYEYDFIALLKILDKIKKLENRKHLRLVWSNGKKVNS